MNTLFHAELSEREFSSHLLHVGDLLAWAESKRLHLRTSPALDGFEFVQVEALLCAIECQSQDLTRDQAAEIVANNPALKNERMAKLNPAWLLGADAHKKWRELLSGAIERHELTLLDFASKLPIDTAPATGTAKPAPVVAASDGPAPVDTGEGLTTKAIAAIFDGVNDWPENRWPRNLSGSKWLHTARTGLGTAGGGSARWNPLALAQLLHERTKGKRPRDLLVKTLKNRFNKNPVLMPWRDSFNEHFATYIESD